MISNFFTTPSFLYSGYREKNIQNKCDNNDNFNKEKDFSNRQLYEWKWSKYTNQMNQKSKKRRNTYNNASHEHFIHDFNRFEQNDKIQSETNVYIDEYKTMDKPNKTKQNQILHIQKPIINSSTNIMQKKCPDGFYF